MEKVQWNSINKKQNGLKYSKNDNSPTLTRNIREPTSALLNENNFYPVSINKVSFSCSFPTTANFPSFDRGTDRNIPKQPNFIGWTIFPLKHSRGF